LPSSEPISCHGRQCHAGAVGCLVHDVFYADDDYNDIKAVKLEWDGDEFRRTDPLDRKLNAMLASVEVQDDGYHCVLPHLNDELYRYCVMIHSHNSGDHCWNSNDHRICCCFVGPGQSTCEPLSDDNVDSSSRLVTIVEGPFD
ncbi:Protein T13C2.3 a, partial [Aphelenchoides avenae]